MDTKQLKELAMSYWESLRDLGLRTFEKRVRYLVDDAVHKREEELCQGRAVDKIDVERSAGVASVYRHRARCAESFWFTLLVSLVHKLAETDTESNEVSKALLQLFTERASLDKSDLPVFTREVRRLDVLLIADALIDLLQ